MITVLSLMKVRSPVLAAVGLLVVGIVALQLVQGQVTLTTAATRVAIVALCLGLADRFLVPLARSLVATGHRPPPD